MKAMDRRTFLKETVAATALGPLALAQTAGGARAARPPNFVVIMADDISPHRYGCYGAQGASTPNLDRLAAGGVAFATCWATPICMPTRAMIMTGRYAHRTGWWHNALRIPMEGNGGNFMKNNLVFSRLLRESGYATAVAGKWQLVGWVGAPEAGFDEHCLYRGNVQPLIERGQTFGGLYESTTGARGYGATRIASRYWGPAVVRNGELMATTPEDFGPDIWTGFLIDFIRRHRDRPFLAYLPMELTHTTAVGKLPSTPLSGRPGDLAGGTLAECNEYLDVLVGRILGALEELGLREDTVVVFTSDNGDQGGDGVWPKNTATEIGARVPFIVGGPGIAPRDGLSDGLVSLADVMPTLLDFAGAGLPDGYELDGRSLAPWLRGRAETHRRWLYSYLGTARMLRDRRWLLEAVDEVYDSPRGRFYDCGDARDPRGYRLYREVTDSAEPEAREARERFETALATLPPPDPAAPGMADILERYDGYVFRHRLKV
jgi:arylsulfatase A-like enzyme